MASDKPQRAKSTIEREVLTKRGIRRDWSRIIVLVSHRRTGRPADGSTKRNINRPIDRYSQHYSYGTHTNHQYERVWLYE